MPTIKITVKNMDSIIRAFKLAPRKMQSELGIAIGKTVLTIESKGKKEAPVNKQSGGGNLRQSIRGTKTGPLSGQIEVGASYGIYVHEGTRPHTIRTRTKKALANKKTLQMFGRVVNHPGTRANPFMQRAVEAAGSDIDRYFIQAVTNALK